MEKDQMTENTFHFNIEEELKKLPGRPGVYIMHDEHDDIIYVGKAISLKNRVRQYFQSSRNKSAKILQMVERIRRFEMCIRDRAMSQLKLAILGAGRIAETMAETVRQMDDVCLYAVAAREEARAKAFAETYGAEHYYGSYEEMLQDDGVELVYIATPHSHHAQHAKLCIEHGRPVLCEKAFTWTAEEAAEVLQLAKEKQVFITEAMWVRYMPMFRMLKETVDSGKIGAVTAVTANLGYALLHKERVTRPELAGGALLDLGVYTLNFATGLLGDEPERIETTMVRLSTGVDKQEFVNLIYPNGVVAGLFNTMVSVTDRKGFIYGTEGHIEVENINNYEEFRIYNNQYELTETIRRPEQLTGYEYEVRACHRALLNGQLECEEMPHVHTMRIMHMLDEIQKKWEEQEA